MKKVLVYPFNREFFSIMNNYNLLFKRNIEIVSLVSLPGWGLSDEVYNINNKNISVTCNFNNSLNDCDLVWIIDSWLPLYFDSYIYPNIKEAASKGKKVLLTRKLSNIEKTKLNELRNNITYLDDINPKLTGRYINVNTPIIAIAGISQNTGKFELELSLKQELEEKGYRVLLIASRREAIITGDCRIPDFMLKNDLSENEKILAFNHYVSKLESEKHPDIIILGIPGAVTSYDNKFFKDYGILAIEIAKAVPIDSLILCSLYGDYKKEYFEECEKTVGEQLCTKIDIHTLSKYSIDETEMLERGNVCYLMLDEILVDKMVKQINYPNLLNPYDKQSLRQIAELLIEKLSTSFYLETI
jgi:peptide maturation system protein (TIGR04066 family)